MEMFQGVVIEESLASPQILGRLQILATRISKVTAEHGTPWLTQWTLHTVAVPSDEVAGVAEELSHAFDPAHPSSWYTDFKSENLHYVVFPGKVFVIDRKDESQYRSATDYGVSIGIPATQVDFGPHIRKAI